ncbi:stage II sporulation protein P [Clostridium carboxidivorans P7]|uniref:Stage II sporulation protein P n=1 Tax=Clostridium carboxidivorans P7 TaxID=536227 RepID=C6PU06_9CLOT|nr:stage II sporulation protein P [Clostridium carboxidivorans P7]EET87305.1 stage II sporulation protein P [Clostridium carboxidivorans P7]
MGYRRNNTKNNLALRLYIVMMSLFIIIIVPFVAKANSYSSNVKRNLFYVQVLNFTMPAVKATSFNEDDMAESRFSLSDSVLNVLGLKMNNPMSVLSKEISYMNLGNDSSKNDVNVNFNQFKLDEKQVSKDNPKSNDSSSGNLNLENKTVNVYDPKLKKTLNTSKPEVLIYHTHTTESYKPGNAISFDTSQNVCAVGDALIDELQKNYGISGINDKTVHDAEAYTQSYERSAVTVDKYLKQYKDFKLVIDLHRDSVDDKKAVTIKMNGENVAKFMLVMARKNPHFDKNMELANKIAETSKRLYPGFCKEVCYYNYGTRYFNQDKSNNAILLEVGADINTTDEAKASAKYLARIIAECLNK